MEKATAICTRLAAELPIHKTHQTTGKEDITELIYKDETYAITSGSCPGPANQTDLHL